MVNLLPVGVATPRSRRDETPFWGRRLCVRSLRRPGWPRTFDPKAGFFMAADDWAPSEPKHVVPTEFLRECFDYTPTTGVLRWRIRPVEHFKTTRAAKRWNTTYANREIVGAPGKYKHVKVLQRVCLVHRVIWAMCYGEFPDGFIDHANGDKHDNRIANLRLALRSENCSNRRVSKRNSTGFKGVSYNKKKGAFYAHIMCRRVASFLGAFATPEEAHAAYCAAADKLHGDFANHG